MDPFVLILAVGGGLVLLLVVIGVAITAGSEKSLVEERLGRYLEDEEEMARAKKGEKSSPVGDWVNKKLEKSKVGGGIARELARADLKLKPGEYVATMVIAAVGGAIVLGYLGGDKKVFPGDLLNLFTVIGAIIGAYLPRIYVNQQKGKRLVRFGDQLADMLNLMVNGLRAGYSTTQAMEAVSKEMPPPISDEFRRVVQELQLGVSTEEALANLLRRIPSDDLDLVVTAINVQREVGGPLAEILDTISYTIRERVRIKGEIRVLTSQVMYSGRFLAMMPLIISGILWLLNKQYMMEFFNPETRIPGLIALGIGGIFIASGYFVMTRIANIEV